MTTSIEDRVAKRCTRERCPHGTLTSKDLFCVLGFIAEECPKYDPSDWQDEAEADAFDAVLGELESLRAKYGEESAEDLTDDGQFAIVLGREYGEVLETLGKHGKPTPGHTQYDELKQVAAVAIARMIGLDKRGE